MKIVMIIFIFTIYGSGMAYAEQLSEKALAKKILKNIETLYKRGVKMEAVRKSFNFKECGVNMRKNQTFAKKVFAESEKLSNDFFMVRVAANPILELCVSCAPFAMKNCDIVKEAIENAREEVK